MRESTSVFQIRTINRSKLDKGAVPEGSEGKNRVLFFFFFWGTEYFRNISYHSSITKIYLDVM